MIIQIILYRNTFVRMFLQYTYIFDNFQLFLI